MKLSTHFTWIALIAIFLAACTDSGPAATGSEIGTSVGGQSSVPFGTSQGGQSSFSMGGGSSSSGGTSGQMGCYVQVPDFGMAFCGAGVSQVECSETTEEGVTATYQACPSGWNASCEGEADDGTIITVYDYTPGGMFCNSSEEEEIQ